MSNKKAPKIRCADCRSKIKKNANHCVNCGTSVHSLGKAFSSIASPEEREQLWNQAYEGGFIAKVARF